MAFPKAISMPTAIEGRSKLDLSCKHITTSDWLQFNVSKYIKMVPGQSIDVRHIPFQRLQPLPVPTFGRGRFVHRAYFVPFRTVWTAWDDFYNGVPHAYDGGEYSIPSFSPLFYSSELVKMFTDPDAEFARVVQDEEYDFEVQSIPPSGVLSDSIYYKYKFTPLGRFAYKLLRSLGYSVTFLDDSSAPTPLKYIETKDALKLLCVAKVYCDHYFPQQYANTEDAIWLNSYFVNNDDLWTDPGSGALDHKSLARIFRCLYRLPYGSDYFTSAWDNPISPNNGLDPKLEFRDITSVMAGNEPYGNYISNGNSPTPVISEDGVPESTTLGITKYALTALNKMTDYVKRMQLVGSRVIDRFFARFGIKLSNEVLKRSVKIAEYYENIAFADVTSMASTDTATLGDYAGKGISGRDSNNPGAFQYSATEHGILVIISINVPEISYYQGEHRDSHHHSRLDFWNPEFDSLGVQALALSELYTPINGREITNAYATNPDEFVDKIFGFTPRYAEYKIPYDQITGDYILRSKGVGVDSWFLARDVSHFLDGDIDKSHSLDFVMSDDKEQFNRIFNNVSNDADHFNVVHYFQITSSFPGKSLFDTYEFENEDKSQKVVVNINGSTESN